jgi:predicted translin family RNA/ssDNA-binding protein
MLNKKFIQKLKKEHVEHNNERRQIISLSNIILHDSKRVIFSLHREDVKKAEESLNQIEKIIIKLDKKFGYNRLKEEGSYKAGVEEYVEARSFFMVLSGKKLEKFKGIKLSYESYLGGICDLSGELVRRAVNKAANGEYKEVEEIKKMINEIMSELVEFDMAGYLRTKYDQARGNLRKIEQINYEINLIKEKGVGREM